MSQKIRLRRIILDNKTGNSFFKIDGKKIEFDKVKYRKIANKKLVKKELLIDSIKLTKLREDILKKLKSEILKSRRIPSGKFQSHQQTNLKISQQMDYLKNEINKILSGIAIEKVRIEEKLKNFEKTEEGIKKSEEDRKKVSQSPLAIGGIPQQQHPNDLIAMTIKTLVDKISPNQIENNPEFKFLKQNMEYLDDAGQHLHQRIVNLEREKDNPIFQRKNNEDREISIQLLDENENSLRNVRHKMEEIHSMLNPNVESHTDINPNVDVNLFSPVRIKSPEPIIEPFSPVRITTPEIREPFSTPGFTLEEEKNEPVVEISNEQQSAEKINVEPIPFIETERAFQNTRATVTSKNAKKYPFTKSPIYKDYGSQIESGLSSLQIKYNPQEKAILYSYFENLPVKIKNNLTTSFFLQQIITKNPEFFDDIIKNGESRRSLNKLDIKNMSSMIFKNKPYLEGQGKYSYDEGTNNFQLDDIMKPFRKILNYKGCISFDNIQDLLSSFSIHDINNSFCFIFNILSSDSLEHETGHWCCVLYSGEEAECCIYDPLGETNTKSHIYKIMENFIKEEEPETYIKMKLNGKVEPDDSTQCGIYCVRYLYLRALGASHKEASAFNKEDDQNILNKIKMKFNYV